LQLRFGLNKVVLQALKPQIGRVDVSIQRANLQSLIIGALFEDSPLSPKACAYADQQDKGIIQI